MKFIHTLIIVVSALTISFSTVAPSCKIKYDGLYKSEIDDEHAIYFRFYKDGTVLHSTSIMDEVKASVFFTKKNSTNILTGKFSSGNCNLKGKASGDTGKISFQGSVEGEIIFISIKNKSNGRSIDKTLEFYPLDLE